MSEADKNPPSSSVPHPAAIVEGDDSDPGYEDLDDILDQFNTSATAKSSNSKDVASEAPAASGPGRPDLSSQPSSQSEAEFMSQLQAELEKTMSNLGVADGTEAKEQAQDLADMGKELEEFTAKMEKEGLQPEDLLRAILGENGMDASKINAVTDLDEKLPGESSKDVSSVGASDSRGTFDETIRKTLERMQASDSSARDAAHSTSEDDQDILAQLMKAMESMDQGSGADGDDADLSNLFLNMMHQLTSKELLYEPMKELDGKFPDWIKKNQEKLSNEDLERYQTQRAVVKEIVDKFEESSYSDANEQDRAFIWEKMQKMQGAGSPPEDLIQAPFPGAFGPSSGTEGQDPLGGCPTQ